MKKPILIGNWKNRPGSLPEAKTLLKALSKNKLLYKKLSLFIAPPYPFFETVSKTVRSFGHLASQDLFPVEKGSFTGFISPEILKSFGVRASIIGHSERRALGETSAQVAEKVAAALRTGISPVICVGEEVRDTEGEHFEFLREQIRSSLAQVKKTDADRLIVAYEPVWAVGENALGVIEPEDLKQTVLFIKKVLTEIFGRKEAEKIPVLYGGSVDTESVQELVVNSGVKGFLVGRASLSGESFVKIAESLINK